MRLVEPADAARPFVLALLVAAAWPVAAMQLGASAVLLLAALALAAMIALRRAERALAAVLVMTPLAGASVDGFDLTILPPHPVKLAIYLLPAIVILCALTVARTRRRPLPWTIAIAFVAFFAVSLAASMQGLRADAATTPLVYVLGSAVLFLAICLVGDTRERLLLISAGALGGLVVAGAQGTFGSLLDVDTLYGFAAEGSVVARLQGSFAHPNEYGLFLALLLPLAVAVAADREIGRTLRCLAAAGIVLGAPALVLSYSRGALVGLVVGSLAWLLVLRPRIGPGSPRGPFRLRRATVRLLALLALAAAVVLAPATVRERFDESSTRSDLSQRNAIWSSALDIYADRPILGVGVGAFPDAYARVSSRAPRATDRPLLNQGVGSTLPYHAHNAFLTVAAEQGALGLLALLALGAAALTIARRACRVRDPVGRAIGIGAGVALAVWSVDNMFNVSLYEETTMPLAALLAVAWGFVALDARDDAQAAA